MEAITSGVDWVTMTLPRGAVLDNDFVTKGLHCLDKIVKEGYELQYSGLQGYQGVKAGGSFVGTRDDGHMIQLSGRHADLYLRDVYRYDVHVSRLDIQTTVKFKKMPIRLAKEAYRDATTENKTIPISRRRKLWIIVGSDGGDTFYCGSSTSDERGRLYNKEVQSEDPLYTRTWRYEVVLRNEKATRLCGNLFAKSPGWHAFCADYVAIWWQKRGVHTPWTATDDYTPLPPIKTLPTDIETKLNWLRHQVRPTVEYLLTVQDKATILELLGLS